MNASGFQIHKIHNTPRLVSSIIHHSLFSHSSASLTLTFPTLAPFYSSEIPPILRNGFSIRLSVIRNQFRFSATTTLEDQGEDARDSHLKAPSPPFKEAQSESESESEQPLTGS
ncbi:unnamed protein product [Vicia faba]|uniref:Uncharacterized protein n=1 Tax=Vicia faba TaxID=3906 RepID=A0AAV1AHV3_VICFA|nr:unnamed protein product [Vicia faba]